LRKNLQKKPTGREGPQKEAAKVSSWIVGGVSAIGTKRIGEVKRNFIAIQALS